MLTAEAAAATGLRRSELISRRWADVDLTRNLIYVDDNPAANFRVKTDEGRRSVPLWPRALKVIGELEARFRRSEDPEEVLLPSTRGHTYIHPEYLGQRFAKQLQRGWVQILKRSWSEAGSDHIALLAASLAGAALAIAPIPPTVIMMVGLQGSGKTTTAGKLARRMKREMRQPRLVACDVYRPAAVDQLQTLGEQVGVPVSAEPGSTDVVGIAKRALETASRERDRVLIVDTAGRLHTQHGLMQELEKIERVVARKLPGAPHERLLVLDSTVGQNAMAQVRTFGQTIELTGLVLTKMDSTAKGGVVVALGAYANARDLFVRPSQGSGSRTGWRVRSTR